MEVWRPVEMELGEVPVERCEHRRGSVQVAMVLAPPPDAVFRRGGRVVVVAVKGPLVQVPARRVVVDALPCVLVDDGPAAGAK